MTQDFDAYVQGPFSAQDNDTMSDQRMAFNALLHLSTDKAEPILRQLNVDLPEAQASVKQQYEQDRQAAESVHESQIQEEHNRFDEQAAHIQSDFQKRMHAVNVDAKRKHDRVAGALKDRQKSLAREKQEKLLVAEFMGEGTVLKAQQTRKTIIDTCVADQQALTRMAQEAEALLTSYRRNIEAPDSEHFEPPAPQDQSPQETFNQYREETQALFARLNQLASARMFLGMRPALWGLAPVALALLGCGLWIQQSQPSTQTRIIALIASAVVSLGASLGIGLVLWIKSGQKIKQLYPAFHEALYRARVTRKTYENQLNVQAEQEAATAQQANQKEVQEVKSHYDQLIQDVTKTAQAALQDIKTHNEQSQKQRHIQRDQSMREATSLWESTRDSLTREHQDNLTDLESEYQRALAELEETHAANLQRLTDCWNENLTAINRMLDHMQQLPRRAIEPFESLLTPDWSPAAEACPILRFGAWHMDLTRVAPCVLERTQVSLNAQGTVTVPALLAFPDACALLMQSDRQGRTEAIDTLRTVMTRLFTCLPPGQVRFSIIDPVGLGENFAGFMHAGDYQESLVGGRIWTETAQIQHQLEELTQHMENVIQKYLRNEFETIEQYNTQAGELAEPYRFLVIADFPTHFNEECARRLSSIVHSGARCGVHTLIAHDTRQELPPGIDPEDIQANSLHLVCQDGPFQVQDPLLKQFAVTLDRPPQEALLTQVMQEVGKGGQACARVEIPFANITPSSEQTWTLDSRHELAVAMGRTGATRLQYANLGRGVSQHMLIAGKTGSGKSTLLHVMITNLALWYSPDEIELYLIDFKKGVEFKTYATHKLAHVRAVAIESDREFGLSILLRLEAEMTHRGNLFRDAGVQDIAAYRDKTDQRMPRTVLMVDEFQVFFSEDDKLAQDAAIALEQLVRQGRAFGIHVILGSQTLGGAFGLARSTMGQMAVRIALQCSEADSQLILDDDNVAARYLSRPGEAIYNDASGRIEGNSPFQVAWLSDDIRDQALTSLTHRVTDQPLALEPLIVFEGNQPAHIEDNRDLAEALTQIDAVTQAMRPNFWLGSPVTIKAPVAMTFKRQSGANGLIVGQRDDVVTHMLSIGLLSLATQLPKEGTRFIILDSTPEDSLLDNTLDRVIPCLPQTCEPITLRQVPEIMTDLTALIDQRVQADEHQSPAIFVVINGLHRYRLLRRSDDDFSFSADADAPANPSAQLGTLLRDGPGVGVHCLAWADTLANIERCIDRQTLKEFDYRVLFQMSAADSSHLIDSTAANSLGFHRALLYSEEQGGIEKFRPYADVTEAWLEKARQQLR
ncbi:MAG: cell division protein FtsK [Planctomycetes bacterium]|nr:cell division protein FtsK [Planctomycetota bacterium]